MLWITPLKTIINLIKMKKFFLIMKKIIMTGIREQGKTAFLYANLLKQSFFI